MKNYLVKAAWILASAIAPLGLQAADTATTAPMSAPTAMADAPQAAPARSAREIQTDLQSTAAEMQKIMPPMSAMIDPAVRAKAAPGGTPLMWKLIGLFDELSTAAPQSKAQMTMLKYRYLGFLALMDDAKATTALADAAISPDTQTAMYGKSTQLWTAWMKSNKDEAGQAKILDDADTLIKANPAANPPAVAVLSMSELGAATPDLQKRAQTMLATDSTSPAAKQVKASMEAEAKVAALENKPLVIEGKTVDGATFSSASYKGKVVLVDFWATWCGPCKAELPRVKAIYKEDHPKGLEIVGVSCDTDGDALRNFVKADPDMPWTQLFTPGTTWHPLAIQYGIMAIPRMLLIDRNGICRTVNARQNMEQLLPSLLSENAPEKASAAN